MRCQISTDSWLLLGRLGASPLAATIGALAFGIGTSEVEHVLATQTLLQKRGKNMRITVNGTLAPGVVSKDVILHIIGKIGTAGLVGEPGVSQAHLGLVVITLRESLHDR